MPNNVRTVSFMTPAEQASALLQQQQIERAQASAAALRQESQTEIPSNGGAISWTQGLAKLAQAVAANHAQRRADALSWDATARGQNAQAAMHDPGGRAIPQIDLTANPYVTSESGRNLAQRLRDFIAGGAPVGLNRPTQSARDSRGPVGGSPSATTETGQPVMVSASNAGGVSPASPPTSDPAAGASSAALAAGLRDVARQDQDRRQNLADAVRASAGLSASSEPQGIPNPIYGSGGVDDDGQQAPTLPSRPGAALMPPPTAAAPNPAGPLPAAPRLQTQAAPSAPAAPPQPGTAGELDYSLPDSAYGLPAADSPAAMPARPTMDALLPTMSAASAYMLSQADPQAYWGAVASAGTPIDDVKRLQQSGIDPRSPQGLALLRAAAAKAMQTPLNDDKRGYLTDAYTGDLRAFHPAMPDGATPVLDSRGNVVGASMLPGVTDARRQTASADAIGRAAGEVQEVFDPTTQTYRAVPRSAVVGGGGGGGPIETQLRPGGSTAGASGPPGYQTKPGLGDQAAAEETGKHSAEAFQQLADSTGDVGNRIYALRQMADINRKVGLGPGSEAATKAASVFNAIGQAFGRPGSFNNRNVTNIAEFNKWAAQYSARAAQQLGLSGSDARMSLTVSATPNGHMTNAALATVIPQMIGFETAAAARAAAGAQWSQRNGPASWQQFSAAWNRAYDPRLFTVQQMPPADQQRFFRSLSPADRKALAQKAATLKSMGAYE